MGASTVAYFLANEAAINSKLITAAVCVQTPMIVSEININLTKTAIGRVYNKALQNNLHRNMTRHCKDPKIVKGFKAKFDFDILETLTEISKEPFCRNWDKHFSCKVYGHETPEDFWDSASSKHIIHKIKTPTLFMQALDDPFILENAFDAEVVAKNSHTVLGTHKFGGHIGYHENFWGLRDHGSHPVIFNFLDA